MENWQPVTDRAVEISDNIAYQLGATRAGLRQIAAFTGARDFVRLSDNGDRRGGLSFSFPRTKNRKGHSVNRVKITLDANDTYSVEFGYVHGGSYSIRFMMSGVYGDMLRDMWWNNTGLALSF